MCGRFALIDDGTNVAQQLRLTAVTPLAPRYNIAPTQPITAVIAPRGPRTLTHFYWGLVPSWAKDISMAGRMINARAETAAEKPSFRNALRRRRCLVPMSGFYEWQKIDGRKQPHYIQVAGQAIFAVAGLWEIWESPEGDTLQSCALLTTAANDLMAPLHDRMPVIIAPADYGTWLDTAAPLPAVEALLRSYPSAAMTHRPVSPYVSNARNEGPACLA
jgi:putative SOS response-associated peptidase YedK